MNIWEYECHKTVDWSEVQTHYLVMKTVISSPVIEIIVPSVLGPFIGAAIAKIWGHFERHRGEKREAKRLSSILFPFEEAQAFVGPRYPWMKKKEVSQNDLKAIGYHLKGLIYAICSFARRKPIVRVKEDKIDFAKPLFSSGGPIPNWYTRNVMYGKEIDLPYKFRLDVTDELREMPPDKLRKAGVKAARQKPNWFIADKLGKPFKVNGKEAKPVYVENKLIEDYFMIISTRNIHPDAKNTNVPCLIVAGCHGPGTAAAGSALKNLDILNQIESNVKGNFQAIGWTRVKNGKPLKDTIKLHEIVSV